MDRLNGAKLHHLDRALPETRVLKLARARGTRIVAVAGEVWITEDGRLDDVVLTAGGSAVLEHDGLAMITPFDSADIEVVLPGQTAKTQFDRPVMDAELIGRYELQARRMRAQAMGAAFANAVEWLRAKLRPAPQHECCA